MKHQIYKKQHETWLDRFRRWFPLGFRWVVRNPEFTKKNKMKMEDIFLLK